MSLSKILFLFSFVPGIICLFLGHKSFSEQYKIVKKWEAQKKKWVIEIYSGFIVKKNKSIPGEFREQLKKCSSNYNFYIIFSGLLVIILWVTAITLVG